MVSAEALSSFAAGVPIVPSHLWVYVVKDFPANPGLKNTALAISTCKNTVVTVQAIAEEDFSIKLQRVFFGQPEAG